MSYFFTTFFRQQLFANQTLFSTPKAIRMCLFSGAPAISGGGAQWVGVKTKAELTAMTGWTELSGNTGYPLSVTSVNAVHRVDRPPNVYILFPDLGYAFTGIEPVGIAAIGFEYVAAPLGGVTNPLMFVTNTPTGGFMNIYPKDSLVASPDPSFPDATNKYLFSWAVPVSGATTLDPVEGPLAINKGAPDFEPSNTLHMWLYPQRANMIANPSFQVDNTYWAPSLTRITLAAYEQDALRASTAGQFSSDSYVNFNAALSDVVYANDSPALSSTGDLDIQVEIAPADWTPQFVQTIISKDNITNGQRSWSLALSAIGTVALNWSADGSVILGNPSTANLSALANGTRRWVRATLDVDNGAAGRTVSYYTSQDGLTWTLLGTPIVTAGVTSVFDSIAPVRLGSYGTSPAQVFRGVIHRGRIYSDLAQANQIASPDFTRIAPDTTSYTDAQGNDWMFQGTVAVGNTIMPLAIESNIWETRQGDIDHELWTFQLMAKGVGKVRVALIYWDVDYRGTNADWGTEEWNLSNLGWLHLTGIRRAPEGHTAMLRIEVMGPAITITKVLCERGALKEWPYFDGASNLDSPGAFSWYGGSARQGLTYSMWYSDRRSVMGRLFATPPVSGEPGDIITDAEVMSAGMVYDWVPAGVTVIPHLDVFYPNDLQSKPPARSVNVLPWAGGETDGVPWGWDASIRTHWGTWTSSAAVGSLFPGIARVGSWTSGNTITGSLVISHPAGAGVGDILVLCIAVVDFGYFGSDFTGLPNMGLQIQALNGGIGSPKMYVWMAPIMSTPPSSYGITFSNPAGHRVVGGIGAYRNVQVSGFSGTYADSGPDVVGTTWVLPNHTPSHAGAMGIAFATAATTDLVPNLLSGFNQQVTREQTGAPGVEMIVFDKQFFGIATQAYPTVQHSSAFRRGLSFSLRPTTS